MRRRVWVFVTMVLALILMAPTCADVAGPATVQAIQCTETGQFVSIGLAQEGAWMFTCEYAVKEYGCDCDWYVYQESGILLTVPSVVDDITASSSANTCFRSVLTWYATNYSDPNRYSVFGGCFIKGIYQSGPNGPQSIEPAPEPEPEGWEI